MKRWLTLVFMISVMASCDDSTNSGTVGPELSSSSTQSSQSAYTTMACVYKNSAGEVFYCSEKAGLQQSQCDNLAGTATAFGTPASTEYTELCPTENLLGSCEKNVYTKYFFYGSMMQRSYDLTCSGS